MLNLPNSLTILRIILGFIVPFMLVFDDFELRVWAAFLFGFASFTDWFDGWYARKYNMVTVLGKILDPIADKVIVLGSFLALSSLTEMNVYSVYWVIPIIVRELSITVYRLIFLAQKKALVVAATWSGKTKTVMQMFTLTVAYFYYMFEHYPSNAPIGNLTANWYVVQAMLLISVVLTLSSGYRFYQKNWKNVKNVLS